MVLASRLIAVNRCSVLRPGGLRLGPGSRAPRARADRYAHRPRELRPRARL